MISLPILDRSGKQVGTYEFDPAELADGVNHQLLHDAVVMYEANQRQGTVQTKSRGMVQGSKKKLYRQKGTGRARMGTKRTGIRRGGGVTFGLTPKDWSYRLPKKALKLATRMAVLSKLRDNQVKVIDSLELPQPKTKEMATVLSALGLAGSSCLITTESYDPMVLRTGRNIEGVSISAAGDLNAHTVLRPRHLLVTKAALDKLRQPSV